MKYAPVIIPTLNRLEHLQRCVNSLLRNEEAQFTELYISVDYPPAEKYMKGYEEVKEYVSKIAGFRKVHIFMQEENLGPGRNRKFLEEKAAQDHDRYVFTDDDNEFADNFLSYVNWGLDTFYYDDDVYAICSKADFDVKEDGSSADYMKLIGYNPYGAGHWFHKNKNCRDYLVQENIDKIYYSIDAQKKLRNESPMVYVCVAEDITGAHRDMRGRDDSITYIDIWENVYCIINEKKCIIPIVGKSRNWGNDGTGVHSVNEEQLASQVMEEIDLSRTWPQEPKPASERCEQENRVLHKMKFEICEKGKRNAAIKFGVNRVLGRERMKKLLCLYRRLQVWKKEEATRQNQVFYG